MLAMQCAAPAQQGLGLGRAATLDDIDALALRLPALAGLGRKQREELAGQTRVYEAPAGTAIMRQGEVSDAAYFLIEGRTFASRQEEDGAAQVLEVHNACDFFGEIAALTSMPRTASVIAEQPTTALQVSAAALRKMMADPQRNRIFHAKMTERMVRMNMVELPRFAELDQDSLRELRTLDSQSLPEAQPMPAPL
jgi:CRP-like cAMP-binding protein